jgi:hypothetical protein
VRDNGAGANNAEPNDEPEDAAGTLTLLIAPDEAHERVREAAHEEPTNPLRMDGAESVWRPTLRGIQPLRTWQARPSQVHRGGG